MKAISILIPFFLASFLVVDSAYGQAATLARQADDIIANLYRLGGRNADRLAQATRQADLRMVENALRQHGPNARAAFDNGGYAILQAGRRHGDEAISLAARNPEAARLVATRPAESLRIARNFGDDALRLENRVPGLLTRNPALFNAEQVQVLTRLSPDAQRQVGRTILRADNPETARRIVEITAQRGPSWVARIPTRYKIGGAIITGAILDRAIFGEKGVTAKIESAAKDLAWSVAKVTGLVVGGLFVLKFILLFTLKRLFTWPKRHAKTERTDPQPKTRPEGGVDTLEVVNERTFPCDSIELKPSIRPGGLSEYSNIHRR